MDLFVDLLHVSGSLSTVDWNIPGRMTSLFASHVVFSLLLAEVEQKILSLPLGIGIGSMLQAEREGLKSMIVVTPIIRQYYLGKILRKILKRGQEFQMFQTQTDLPGSMKIVAI